MKTLKASLILLSFLLIAFLGYSIANNFNEESKIDTYESTTEPCKTFTTEIIKKSHSRNHELPKGRAINQVSILIRHQELKKLESLAKYSKQNGYQVELEENHSLDNITANLITIKMKKTKIELDEVLSFVESIQEEKRNLEIDDCILALDYKIGAIQE